MFGRWSKEAAEDVEGHALRDSVKEQLGDADDETVRIVTAIAGLLGGVAYADREYSQNEEAHVREMLLTVNGLTPSGVDAILSVLREHIVEIATVQASRYSRTLVELANRDLRVQVLEMLVDLAATDTSISHDEVVLLRNTAQALGLDQDEYNRIQQKHRDKLSVFNKS